MKFSEAVIYLFLSNLRYLSNRFLHWFLGRQMEERMLRDNKRKMKNCSAQWVHFSMAMSSGPLFIACGRILSHRRVLSSFVFFIAVVEGSKTSRKCSEAVRFWSIIGVFGLLNRHDCAHTSLENKVSFKWLILFIFRLLMPAVSHSSSGKGLEWQKKKVAFGPESWLCYFLGLHRFISLNHEERPCKVLNPIHD